MSKQQKLTSKQKADALLAAELKSALEYQEGYDLGLVDEPEEAGRSLLYDAGHRAGHNELVRRIKEATKKKKELSKRLTSKV